MLRRSRPVLASKARRRWSRRRFAIQPRSSWLRASREKSKCEQHVPLVDASHEFEEPRPVVPRGTRDASLLEDERRHDLVALPFREAPALAYLIGGRPLVLPVGGRASRDRCTGHRPPPLPPACALRNAPTRHVTPQ